LSIDLPLPDDLRLIVSFWGLRNIGDPDELIGRLRDALRPEGMAVFIESAERPALPGQQLSLDILAMQLELRALSGAPARAILPIQIVDGQLPEVEWRRQRIGSLPIPTC